MVYMVVTPLQGRRALGVATPSRCSAEAWLAVLDVGKSTILPVSGALLLAVGAALDDLELSGSSGCRDEA